MNRQRQLEILTILDDIHPEALPARKFPDHLEPSCLLSDLFYLQGHNLIEFTYCKKGNAGWSITSRITSRGMDFLKDDGGLSAILGVVTIKLHEDTIRELLLIAVDQSATTKSDKETLKATISRTPSTAFSEIVRELCRRAVLQSPDALQLIRDILPF